MLSNNGKEVRFMDQHLEIRPLGSRKASVYTLEEIISEKCIVSRKGMKYCSVKRNIKTQNIEYFSACANANSLVIGL